MSIKRKLSKILFCLLLGFGSMSGILMEPKQIEDVLRLMNETKIEVVIPKDDDKRDQDVPAYLPQPTKSETERTQVVGAGQCIV